VQKPVMSRTLRVAWERPHGKAERLAHAVPDIGSLTASSGVALCGYLAEALTLVPKMGWADVALSDRCQHCATQIGHEST
jgi:hypothetical protein